MNLMTFIWIAHLHIQAIKKEFYYTLYCTTLNISMSQRETSGSFQVYFSVIDKKTLLLVILLCGAMWWLCSMTKIINNVYHQVDHRCWIQWRNSGSVSSGRSLFCNRSLHVHTVFDAALQIIKQSCQIRLKAVYMNSPIALPSNICINKKRPTFRVKSKQENCWTRIWIFNM